MYNRQLDICDVMYKSRGTPEVTDNDGVAPSTQTHWA